MTYLYFVSIFFIFILIIGIYLHNRKIYIDSSYYKITKHPYWQLWYNKGISGEYSIYKALSFLENQGAKFLFNLYIPTYNNKTTEIDVVMIASEGIFVFESKNYSGWIFGTEGQKKWTQTLPSGYGNSTKEHFYNPIMQNENHIKYLKKLLNDNIKYFSIIVFSDKCEFKNIKVKINSESILIHKYKLNNTVKNIMANSKAVLSNDIISQIYNKLLPYSQVDETIKKQHIANIKN